MEIQELTSMEIDNMSKDATSKLITIEKNIKNYLMKY